MTLTVHPASSNGLVLSALDFQFLGAGTVLQKIVFPFFLFNLIKKIVISVLHCVKKEHPDTLSYTIAKALRLGVP